MKQFLIKVIIASLPILLAAFGMELMLRKTPNDYLLKNQYLEDNAADIETLILGSSHAYYDFDPEYFSSKTFNASHISQSLNYDFEIFKKYQNKLKNLKTVILPISYFSLYGKLEAGSESWRAKNYVIYYGVSTSKSLTDFSEVLSNKFSVNVERLASYYLLNESNVSCSKLGWGTQYKSQNARDLVDTGKKSAKRHTIFGINTREEEKTLKENVHILITMLQWCKEHNIHVYLLTPPAYESYRQDLNEQQLQTTINTTSTICSKFDNCMYENLMNAPNFVAIDYFDADHLSDIGAKKLSLLINEKINKWK